MFWKDVFNTFVCFVLFVWFLAFECFGFFFFFQFHEIQQGQMKNPATQEYRLRNDWLENSSAKKDLVILEDIKLNVSQKCPPTKVDNSILSCVSRSTDCRSSKMIILINPVLWHTIQERQKLEQVQRATGWSEGWKTILWAGMGRTGFVSPGKAMALGKRTKEILISTGKPS